MDPVKVMIADDHPLIREGLVKVIGLEPTLRVVGEAVDGEDLINKAGSTMPDVILFDLHMPNMDGLEAAKIIRERYPNIRLIALTVEDSEQRVVEVIKSGVNGYILKDIEPGALASAIAAVHAGGTVIHPQISSILFRELSSTKRNNAAYADLPNESYRLTSREVQVLSFITQGMHNRQIAGHLYISEKTVKNHVTNIFKKLAVEDRTQAVLTAIKQKLVDF